MSGGQLKGMGIGCLALCALLVFVACERYHANAQQVEAAKRMMESSPLGGMMSQMAGGPEALEPAMPTISKHALFFAAMACGTGVVFLVAGANKGAASGVTPSAGDQPPTD